MAAKPIEMSRLRKVLKLYSQGQSKNFISNYLRLSRNTVKKYIKQFELLKTTFEALDKLSDVELEDLFIKSQREELSPKLQDLYSFFPYANKELRRTGVTKLLLWEEYKEKYPEGVQSTQFCEHFMRWSKRSSVKWRCR